MVPLVSVIIPVYNGEFFLANAIQTVKNQNYSALEIIVVDDGSTDATADIAAQFNNEIQYLYQSNQGPAAARNRAIEVAQGDIYAFMDVDDAWVPGAFEQLLKTLIFSPTTDIVRGLIQEEAIVGHNLDNTDPSIRSGNYYGVNLGSALFRKSVFHTVGPFDPSLAQAEDLDWFIRAWEKQIEKIDVDTVFLIYQKHGNNITRARNMVVSGCLHAYKRHIDRLRTGLASPQHPIKPFPTIAQYLHDFS
jgi:glycosyltransferase involved in cell wall biosynthesis